MKKPVKVVVTGAAGQIGYSLLFRIGAGDMLGTDQPIDLMMLERNNEQSLKNSRGVQMELDDCAFPLLNRITATSDPYVCFKDAEIALLVGSRPRTADMQRADLLAANAQIFVEQGKAMNEVADRNIKVLVVGNPCNTNAYIARRCAPDLNPRNDASGRKPHSDSGCSEGQLYCRSDLQTSSLGQPRRHNVPGFNQCHRRRQTCFGSDY